MKLLFSSNIFLIINHLPCCRRMYWNVTSFLSQWRFLPKTVAIRETGKKVAIYKNDKIIAIYSSLGEAAKHFQEKEYASHISDVCTGKRKNIKGYTAKFTDNEVFNENMFLPTLKTIQLNAKKPVAMIDIKTGQELKIFESGCDAGRYFQLKKPSSATTCIKRAIERDGTWRKYKWKYI